MLRYKPLTPSTILVIGERVVLFGHVRWILASFPPYLFGVTYQFQVQETNARINPGQIVNLENVTPHLT